MAEMFASPAKRRKMCADAVGTAESLADAGYSSKAVLSRLKGDRLSTPSKPKQKHEAEPQTPGCKQPQSGTEEGLLSVSPQLLAPNLMLLNQLLGALYVTLPLVRSRGKPTTYQNMRTPVQNFCGRDFQVKHLQQIKALYPEAFGWEHIQAINPTTRRQEQQVRISMPTDPANPKQAADANHMQQMFFQRLQQHQACAGSQVSELELPLAELPPPAGSSTRDSTPSRQRIGSLLPATPQTAPPVSGNTAHNMMSPPPKRLATAVRPAAVSALMSPPPTRTRGNRKLLMDDKAAQGKEAFTFSPAPRQPEMLLSPRGLGGAFGARTLSTPVRLNGSQDAPVEGHQTPVLRPNKLFDTPVASATPQQASTARPNTHATPDAADAEARSGGRTAAAAAGVKVRKLTFDAAASTTAKKAPAPTPKPCAVEAPKARRGIKFELGKDAMALLQQVSSAEAKQEAAVKHEQLEQERALDMLPGSFEVLRAIFGERGPCVKPQAEVLTLLRQKSTSKSGMAATDAADQLDLMTRMVPDFLRAVTSSGASLAGITQSVRINRQLSWPAARQKLLAAAAEARCSGAAAAAAALAAEQEREVCEAAAAAALELDDDGSLSGSESEEEVAEAGLTDDLGLDVCAGPRGSNTGSRGASGRGKAGSDGLADEALALLGGSSSSSSGKAKAAGSLLGALTFKAPARKSTRV